MVVVSAGARQRNRHRCGNRGSHALRTASAQASTFAQRPDPRLTATIPTGASSPNRRRSRSDVTTRSRFSRKPRVEHSPLSQRRSLRSEWVVLPGDVDETQHRDDGPSSGALCPPRGKVVDTGHTSPYRWQPVTAVVAPDVSEVLLDLLGAHLRYARLEIFEGLATNAWRPHAYIDEQHHHGPEPERRAQPHTGAHEDDTRKRAHERDHVAPRRPQDRRVLIKDAPAVCSIPQHLRSTPRRSPAW